MTGRSALGAVAAVLLSASGAGAEEFACPEGNCLWVKGEGAWIEYRLPPSAALPDAAGILEPPPRAPEPAPAPVAEPPLPSVVHYAPAPPAVVINRHGYGQSYGYVGYRRSRDAYDAHSRHRGHYAGKRHHHPRARHHQHRQGFRERPFRRFRDNPFARQRVQRDRGHHRVRPHGVSHRGPRHSRRGGGLRGYTRGRSRR